MVFVKSSREIPEHGFDAARLYSEFDGVIDAQQIEAVIEDSLTRWADAPIQTYIPVLAERYARERLRELAGAQRAG
jgi:hypothetical protein